MARPARTDPSTHIRKRAAQACGRDAKLGERLTHAAFSSTTARIACALLPGMNADFDLDRFSRIFACEAPDAIIYADAEGRIRFWNKGAERIFGFSESDAVGQTLDIIIPEHLRKRHWDGFMRTMQTGKTRYGAGDVLEVPALRKDEKRISVEFAMLPFHDDNGRTIGIAVVLRDVTERFDEMKALRERLGVLSSRSSSWH